MPEITMPRMSDSMEEGTILKWLKADGDEVARGEELAEIETDKATMTYESPEAGTLKITAQEGETLAVGAKIAVVGDDAAGGEDGGGDSAPAEEPEEPAADEPEATPAEEPEEPAAEEPEAAPTEEPEEPAAEEPEAEEPEEPAAEEPEATAPAAEEPKQPVAEADTPQAGAGEDGGRVKASPVARRVAREHGVDLAALSGTGPGGRIVKADVEAAAEGGQDADDGSGAADGSGAGAADGAAEPERAEPQEKKAAPAPAERGTAKGDVTHQELTRTQQVIARRMAESKATVPEFTLQTEIDMEGAVALRAQLKEVGGDGPVPSYNDLVVKACALALRDVPRANGAYRDGRFELYGRVNVGVAVAAQDTLVVPTVFDADTKSLGTIARDTRALAESVRDATVTPPQLSGGTFTVSNLGMYGVTNFTAVINPPQAAILAVGAMEPRAVVRDGEVVVRHRMAVTLACDHRILYGADAAQFLARIRERLEQPLSLAL